MKYFHALLLFLGLGPLITQAQTNNLFLNQPRDKSTDLYYLQQRYYDPKVGRFTQVDPLLRDFGTLQAKPEGLVQLKNILANPQRLNSYSYALNNPVTKIDKTGTVAVSKDRQSRFDKMSDYIRNNEDYWLVRDRDGNQAAIDNLWQKSLDLSKNNISVALDTFFDAVHIDWSGQKTLDKSHEDFRARLENLPNALSGEWGGNRENIDKLQHFAASARLNYRFGPKVTYFLGWAKEMMDGVSSLFKHGLRGYFSAKVNGAGFSRADLMADEAGLFWCNEYKANQTKPSVSIKQYLDSFPF